MPLTVSEARTTVLEHLDDESGVRYARLTGANTENFAKIDRALRSALSRCVDDYVRAGGDRLDEQISVTTDSADGTVSLAAYDRPTIRNVLVSVNSGSYFYPLQSQDKFSRGTPDTTARDLSVTIVRSFTLPAIRDTSDALVSAGDGSAQSWDAFDHWVCARAALQLGIKDDELRQSLVATIQDLERSILTHRRQPAGMPWPSRQNDHAWRYGLSRNLEWTWLAKEQKLALFYPAR